MSSWKICSTVLNSRVLFVQLGMLRQNIVCELWFESTICCNNCLQICPFSAFLFFFLSSSIPLWIQRVRLIYYYYYFFFSNNFSIYYLDFVGITAKNQTKRSNRISCSIWWNVSGFDVMFQDFMECFKISWNVSRFHGMFQDFMECFKISWMNSGFDRP